MKEKNLLKLDLQLFGDEIEETGENDVTETADQSGEEPEGVETETVEEDGNDEPQEQTPEENARYAAARRRAEEDARRKQESIDYRRNQRVAALCQGYTNPVTGKPVTSVDEYFDALEAQQKADNEQLLQQSGLDPKIIERMIATNPVVMQAQQVMEQTKQNEAHAQIQRDIAEISRFDPNVKTFEDLANLPNYPEMVDYVAKMEGKATIADAYKLLNFEAFMNHTGDAARQQAINQMRGKDHLSTNTGVATEDDDVEVPADIMARWKDDGKTEKQIKELYKKVIGKLH